VIDVGRVGRSVLELDVCLGGPQVVDPHLRVGAAGAVQQCDERQREQRTRDRDLHGVLPGSAESRPPRTVAPTTIAAAISTRFLMMYCPSSVGAYGNLVKVSCG